MKLEHFRMIKLRNKYWILIGRIRWYHLDEPSYTTWKVRVILDLFKMNRSFMTMTVTFWKWHLIMKIKRISPSKSDIFQKLITWDLTFSGYVFCLNVPVEFINSLIDFGIEVFWSDRIIYNIKILNYTCDYAKNIIKIFRKRKKKSAHYYFSAIYMKAYSNQIRY